MPYESVDIQLRLCIIANKSVSRHRAHSTTESQLVLNCKWITLSGNAVSFLGLVCNVYLNLEDRKVPHQFGPSTYGTRPNDLTQFDYIGVGPHNKGDKYILMLPDDFAGFILLLSFPDTWAENATLAIMYWYAVLEVQKSLRSDGSTRFKKETLRSVTRRLQVPHHFPLPYYPWSNGGIERLGKNVGAFFPSDALRATNETWRVDWLATTRAVCSE